MAFAVADRVRETTTTTGTGTLDLAGAVSGFRTFVSGIGDGNVTYYAIVHRTAAEFEIGIGTVTDASTDTLSRTTVLSSSNSNSAVTFSAGTKDVFCTFPASKTMDMTLTTAGDILYASANNTPARLAKGSALQVLQMNAGATAPEWATSSSVSAGFVIAMSVAL